MTVLRIIHATIILVVPLIVTAAFNRKHVAFLSSFLVAVLVCWCTITIPKILDASWLINLLFPIISLYALFFALTYCGFWVGVAALASYLHRNNSGLK
jgi:hypothetical protein